MNVDHFYVDSRRYPWQLSRYGPACKPCTSEANGAARAARKPLRNTRERTRRAIDKANRINAAYFFSPQWLAIKAQQDASARERKTRKAWVKRQLNRVRGPYRDPIKALIRERQTEAIRRRGGGTGGLRQASASLGFDVEQRDHLALLQALREKHRAEAQERAAATRRDVALRRT
ncbi:hypothetical protein [Variovorax paradoxus]|uniref:hypothetical protein n=1 Tax=Variovorax paradoxus TaxID=34073 RepID=UPI0027D8CCAE|nr:hypothetical protein [Variovorax paradoxus]